MSRVNRCLAFEVDYVLIIWIGNSSTSNICNSCNISRCLACKKGVSESEYCKRVPNTMGCDKIKYGKEMIKKTLMKSA